MQRNATKLFTSAISAFLAFSSTTVIAQGDYTFTIVNHYGEPLTFFARQNAVEVFPDFPETFDLMIGETKQTRVADIQKHAYEKVLVKDDGKRSAFFGVDIQDGKVMMHGYLGKGIAYSWSTNHVVVTFCTPEDYQKYGQCI